MIAANMPKGAKGDTVFKLLHFTEGLMHLPNAGGVLDQPHRLMMFFDYFESGEADAFSHKLK